MVHARTKYCMHNSKYRGCQEYWLASGNFTCNVHVLVHATCCTGVTTSERWAGHCTVCCSIPVGMFSVGILLTALSPSVFLSYSWWQQRLLSCTVLAASFWGQVPLLCLWRPWWGPACSDVRLQLYQVNWPRCWISAAGTVRPTAAEERETDCCH